MFKISYLLTIEILLRDSEFAMFYRY